MNVCDQLNSITSHSYRAIHHALIGDSFSFSSKDSIRDDSKCDCDWLKPRYGNELNELSLSKSQERKEETAKRFRQNKKIAREAKNEKISNDTKLK